MIIASKSSKEMIILTTGGTIASARSGVGLSPTLGSEGITSVLARSMPGITFSSRSMMNLDSSNIEPEQWQDMAREVYDCLDLCDGVIITHGTDTMAYSAAALSFMLRNLTKPVVFTGSMIPLVEPMSDAVSNLELAATVVDRGIMGVTIAFRGAVMNGTRAVKTSSMDMQPFESINAPLMAELKGDGLRVYSQSTSVVEPSKSARLYDKISTDVALIKMIPGTDPAMFDSLIERGVRGVVIETFGTGGVHCITRNIVDRVSAMRDAGIVVAVTSQCLRERVDLSSYEIGSRLFAAGVIPTEDMTTEAVVTKMMWALGRAESKDPIAEVSSMFMTNYAGEITLPRSQDRAAQ